MMRIKIDNKTEDWYYNYNSGWVCKVDSVHRNKNNFMYDEEYSLREEEIRHHYIEIYRLAKNYLEKNDLNNATIYAKAALKSIYCEKFKYKLYAILIKTKYYDIETVVGIINKNNFDKLQLAILDFT